MNPPNPIGALSRTNSALSFSSTSEDDASLHASSQLNPNTVTVMNSTRRTRKRFTNVQLTMLENLFHQNSHPSREDREAVAKAGGMEIKSVTIWFQNKRQTERKSAASNSGQANTFNEANVQPNITSTIHTFSLHNDSHSTSRTASPSYTTPFSANRNGSAAAAAVGGYSLVSSTHHHHHQTGHHLHHHHHNNNNNSHTSTTNASSSSRPSLDRVASRSELRNVAPRTPSSRRSNNPSGQIYDNMPSSPLAPPVSPPSRDYIDFSKHAKSRRTLEWACAAARLVDGPVSGSSVHGHGHGGHHHNPHHQYRHHQQHQHTGHAVSASAEATPHGHVVMSKNNGNHGSRGRSAHRERSHSGGGSSGGNAAMRECQQHHGQNHRYSSSSSHHQHRSSSTRRDRLSRSSSSMTLRGESSINSVSSSTSASNSYRGPTGHSHTHHGHGYDHYNSNYYSMMDVDVTDSEEDDQDHEAITPPSTWGRSDVRWSATRSSSSSMATSPALSSTSREGSGCMMSLTSAAAAATAAEGKALPRVADDDAMFKAALALCGLGGRRV